MHTVCNAQGEKYHLNKQFKIALEMWLVMSEIIIDVKWGVLEFYLLKNKKK